MSIPNRTEKKSTFGIDIFFLKGSTFEEIKNLYLKSKIEITVSKSGQDSIVKKFKVK